MENKQEVTEEAGNVLSWWSHCVVQSALAAAAADSALAALGGLGAAATLRHFMVVSGEQGFDLGGDLPLIHGRAPLLVLQKRQDKSDVTHHCPITLPNPDSEVRAVKPFEHRKWNSDLSRNHLTHHKHHSEPLLFLTSQFSCGSLMLHRKKTEAAAQSLTSDWLEITVNNTMCETTVVSCYQQKMKQRKDGRHTSSVD